MRGVKEVNAKKLRSAKKVMPRDCTTQGGGDKRVHGAKQAMEQKGVRYAGGNVEGLHIM